MSSHPALQPGRVAVITGGASGIGFAAAKKFTALGMKVVIADWREEALDAAREKLVAATNRPADIRSAALDVGDEDAVIELQRFATQAFGDIGILMNNAATGGHGGLFENPANWKRILNANLWGVIHGVQAFAPGMAKQEEPSLIVNTGSKQGITCPPGDTAYNVSKAGVKVVTEALQHELRNMPDCKVTAHLLIPGFTFTGLTAAAGGPKPPAAWTPEQVIDFMITSIEAGDFYILCPDNDVPRALDEKRMAWAMGDIIENRPPLSRWHADWKDKFAAYVKA
jgi:NAD(P)-dependent dehydrogenase (short-subunit alcohol dehydrogenase family)